MARPERVLTETEQLETKVFILENHFSQMRLHDASANKYAIELLRDMQKSSMTFEESKKFIENTCESAAVVDLVTRLMSYPESAVAKIEKEANRIIEDLG